MPGLSGSQKAITYSNSNILRSGAGRSGYYKPTLLMRIGGSGGTMRKFDLYTWEVNDVINEQPNTASFDVFGTAPSEGQEIEFGIGAVDNYLFRGTITKVTQAHARLTSRAVYRLECIDWSYLLDRRLVMKQYTSQTATAIAQDLISSFTSGFTSSNVQVGLDTIDFFPCTMESVSSALTRLANLIGGYWYLDYNKDLHFFTSEATDLPTSVTTANAIFSAFSYTRDLSQIRTRAKVEGWGSTTTAAVAVGATSIPVADCSFYEVPGTVKVGSQEITYTGRSVSSGAGNLTGVPGSGAGSVLYAINSGDDVNILVTRNDTTAQTALAALEGGDGIHEVFIQDRRLNTAGATNRGNAELTLFKNVLESGSYVTWDVYTRSGKSVTVTMPAWSVSGTFKIQKVRLYSMPGRQWPQRQVEFSSNRRDLYDILRHFQEVLVQPKRR